MSFPDHAILWLHITAAVFTIGPGTAAIMSTPRYIKKRNTVVVGYLLRTTRIYSIAALLTLIFGLISTAQQHKFSQWWISASLTLFIIAFVLLLLIMRDQRKALAALAKAEETAEGDRDTSPRSDIAEEEAGEAAAADDAKPAPAAAADFKIAAVERARIASISGVTALIWLAILVLMVFNAS
jgi:hypothetical protein